MTMAPSIEMVPFALILFERERERARASVVVIFFFRPRGERVRRVAGHHYFVFFAWIPGPRLIRRILNIWVLSKTGNGNAVSATEGAAGECFVGKG